MKTSSGVILKGVLLLKHGTLPEIYRKNVEYTSTRIMMIFLDITNGNMTFVFLLFMNLTLRYYVQPTPNTYAHDNKSTKMY